MPSELSPTSRSIPKREPRLLIVRSFRQLIAMRGILGASFFRFETLSWRREAAGGHRLSIDFNCLMTDWL
jgi:hypothetical protein